MLTNYCKYISTGLLFLVYILGFGQLPEFEFKQISQAHGLPGVTVRHIFQDSKGLMWLGVESYGLCKYDGYSFELYNHSPNNNQIISNNVIETICDDNAGNLWIGTQYGLNNR